MGLSSLGSRRLLAFFGMKKVFLVTNCQEIRPEPHNVANIPSAEWQVVPLHIASKVPARFQASAPSTMVNHETPLQVLPM